MISPTSKYLPIETKLDDFKLQALKHTIAYKEKELRKCRRGDIEASLWLMEQLQYLRKMLDYQGQSAIKSPRRTKK